MSPRTKQQVVAEFRAHEILTAARKVFGQKGYASASVDEVAAAAGLAKATIYQYFSSKHEIYLAALLAGVSEMAERTQLQMSLTEGGIRAKVEAFVRTRLEFLYANQEFFAVYHAEFGNLIHPASLNLEFRSLHQRQFKALEAVLRDAVERGELASICVATLTTMIYESTRGMMLRRSLGWTDASVEQHVTALMRILWDGVATHPASLSLEKVRLRPSKGVKRVDR